MPEIIYPSIIIVSLSTIFYLFWKKAYEVEANAVDVPSRIDDSADAKQEEPLAGEFSEFWSSSQAAKEPEEPVESKSKKEPSVQVSEAMEKAEDLFKKGRYISAEKWFIEAAKENPKDAKIYSRLGIIYLQQKNYSDAQEALEESVRLGGNVASRYFNLSYACWCQSKFRQASEHARHALKLEPENKKYKSWLEKLRSEGF